MQNRTNKRTIGCAMMMMIALGSGVMACSADATNADDGEAITSSDANLAVKNDKGCQLVAFYASGNPHVQRALNWVGAHVMYNKAVTSQSKPYRADCSGLVSMAWELPAPGDDTAHFFGGPRYDHSSYGVSWDEIQPGDALNDSQGSHGHVMLFAGWGNEAKTEICVIEEFAPGNPAEVVRHSLSDKASSWGGGPAGQAIRDVYLPIRKTGE